MAVAPSLQKKAVTSTPKIMRTVGRLRNHAIVACTVPNHQQVLVVPRTSWSLAHHLQWHLRSHCWPSTLFTRLMNQSGREPNQTIQKISGTSANNHYGKGSTCSNSMDFVSKWWTTGTMLFFVCSSLDDCLICDRVNLASNFRLREQNHILFVMYRTSNMPWLGTK